jgi:hypothetical protein
MTDSLPNGRPPLPYPDSVGLEPIPTQMGRFPAHLERAAHIVALYHYNVVMARHPDAEAL